MVNNLRNGAVYLFAYKVAFDKNFENLAFGMTITTTLGIEIAGVSTWGHRDKLVKFQRGQIAHVSFRFTCLLQDGLYFLRCGVANEESGFIHRRVDVMNFKVSSSVRRIQSGLADLGASIKISSGDDSLAILEASDRHQ